MTAETYLNRLSHHLKKCDDRAEIIADMAEHFRSAAAAGQSEDSITAALQSPKALAREFRGLRLARDSGETPGVKRSARLLWHALRHRFARVNKQSQWLIRLVAGAIITGALLIGVYSIVQNIREPLIISGTTSISLPPTPAVLLLTLFIVLILGSALLVGLLIVLRRSGVRSRAYLLAQKPNGKESYENKE